MEIEEPDGLESPDFKEISRGSLESLSIDAETSTGLGCVGGDEIGSPTLAFFALGRKNEEIVFFAIGAAAFECCKTIRTSNQTNDIIDRFHLSPRCGFISYLNFFEKGQSQEKQGGPSHHAL